MKVIKQIDERTFVIQLFEKDVDKKHSIKIMHDYVQFDGYSTISTPVLSGIKITGAHSFCSNNIYVPSYVQIPIRTMIKTVLPLLKKNPCLKESHIKDRIHTQDDKIGGNFKKGDSYVPYSHYPQILFYYDYKKEQKMVSVLMAGEREPTHVTVEFYNKFIKNKS